ncbi:hypothetical protein [Micromonospora sp. ATCC 39149]|uniref:hypothetical protein n=1 Tax=Micromonospora sp. (strain ATCC 39149 / NRRL 15099 / SCC 1413) TaxID=219305 RepID=UPI00055B31F0|nr:hypothetical protein [Micromonospora sp. ATCC 39149]
MTERIAFHRVNADGSAGAELGTAELTGDRMTYTSATARDTVTMLARRFRRTEAEIVALIAHDGWSNGAISAVAE